MGRLIYALAHYKTFPASSHRFQESAHDTDGIFPRPDISDVYFPIKMIGPSVPSVIFLEISYKEP